MLIGALLFLLGAFTSEGDGARKSPKQSRRKLDRQDSRQASVVTTGCTINLPADSPTYPPFIYTATGLLMPQIVDSARVLTLGAGESITLACPGIGNYLQPTATPTATLTCSSGLTFTSGSATYNFPSLSCAKVTKEAFKEIGTCGSTQRGTSVLIGWDIGGTFKEQIRVCHDKVKMETLYTSAIVNGTGIAAKDLGDARPSFKKGTYYPGISVDTLYSQSSQQTVFNSMFSSDLAVKYFDVAKNLYFARGHFIPEADFVWNVMQDATFYYINAAPQYQAFNNGNWKYLESAVRNLAAATNADLQVLTGSFGILTLPDSSGVQKAIYLGKDANGNQILPAPKFYWKVVYDPISKKATAVVGINNPFLTQITSDCQLCNDVCPSVSWIPASRTDFAQGYTYCCSLSELRAKIPDIPDLGNVSLLV